MIDLGTGTSFDVSSYTGYQNFTIDNFFISDITTTSASFSKSGTGWSSDHTETTSGSVSLTKIYDASTGILSCYTTVKCSHSGGNSHNGTASSTGTVNVYLKI